MNENVGFCSPNSALPKEELEQLKHCIMEANELLNALSNPKDQNYPIALRNHLRKLIGLLIRVSIACCEDQKDDHLGVLETAGNDFIHLNIIEKNIFIPFNCFCTIQQADDKIYQEHRNQEYSKDICPSLRKDLVLNFGKVVSKNLELMNVFFGIPLYLQLSKFINQPVSVKTKEEYISGKLIETTKEYIQLQIEQEIRQIQWNKICYLSIENVC